MKVKKVWKKKKVMIPTVMIFILLAICFLYVNDYYHADKNVQDYFQDGGLTKIQEITEGFYLDGPGKDTAVIFYPGAKVEYTAYLPLLHKLTNEGIDCFLVKMPCNLAFLGMNKADKIISSYEYEHWYMAGHSLGGAMAASYASDHLDKLEGLILLASYSIKELKSESFSVISIYGNKDGLLSMDKLEEGRKLMPSNYSEICIEGGNHAGFGNYGSQKGDLKADISTGQQQDQTVDAILKMVRKEK